MPASHNNQVAICTKTRPFDTSMDNPAQAGLQSTGQGDGRDAFKNPLNLKLSMKKDSRLSKSLLCCVFHFKPLKNVCYVCKKNKNNNN